MSGAAGTVRAAGIDRLGSAGEIHCLDLPRPRCGPGQVLLRVSAVAVNHVDTFVRSGTYPTVLHFPLAVGRDAVGIIEQTGDGVEGFSVGQRAWTNSLGFAGRPGATAELVAVDAERAYPLPAGVDPVVAAAALHPCATAALAVHRHGAVGRGESVYIAGGAGNVGSAAIVLAARHGARVLASAAAGDAACCRGLGAETVVDYRDEGVAARLREAAPGGIDVQIETSGRNDLEAAVGLAAPRGRIVVLAGPESAPVLPVGKLYMRDASVLGFAISNATVGELAQAAATVNTMLSERSWEPRHIRRLAFADAGRAHGDLEAGNVRGTRIVLLPEAAG
ncbi:NADPH:quinone reductase [Arthrobacter sp.]|uniref:NADPH:quinone reductase n=1 Tax=Arthrobacter sp. TaxID=1667 RepID=UPI003A95DDCD